MHGRFWGHGIILAAINKGKERVPSSRATSSPPTFRQREGGIHFLQVLLESFGLGLPRTAWPLEPLPFGGSSPKSFSNPAGRIGQPKALLLRHLSQLDAPS